MPLRGVPDPRHEVVADRRKLGDVGYGEADLVVDREVVVADGEDLGRRLREHPRGRPHGLEQNRLHLVRRVLVGEADVERLVPRVDEVVLVHQHVAGDLAVRHDHGVAEVRVQPRRPPVDLRHPSKVVAVADPIAHRVGLLEEDRDAGEHIAQRVLQGQPDHDRADAERGEQPAEVLAPHGREDYRRADQNEQEPRQVQEERRHPRPPRPAVGLAEEHRIDQPQNGRQRDQIEGGRDEPHRQRVARP